MPIELAADNHIYTECVPLSKADLRYIKSRSLMWHTLAEWKDAVESGFYQDHDCDGTWGCEWDDAKWHSSIAVHQSDIESDSIPEWATHVLWSSK